MDCCDNTISTCGANWLDNEYMATLCAFGFNSAFAIMLLRLPRPGGLRGFPGMSAGQGFRVQVNVQRRDRLLARSRTCKDVP